MSRSINNQDIDWKREWEEEQILTPEEKRKAAADKREEDRIYDDLQAMLAEVRQIREDEDHAERMLEMSRRRWKRNTMRKLNGAH